MKKVTLEINIEKPAAAVFSFAINPENTPKWVDGIVAEETNESPTRLGTLYKNQDRDGNWSEFEITDFEDGKMFELTKRDDNHHVRTKIIPISDYSCRLEYCVWVELGEVSDRFTKDAVQEILNQLKKCIEQD